MLKVNDERRTDDENDGRSRIGKDQLSLQLMGAKTCYYSICYMYIDMNTTESYLYDV